MSKSMRAKSIAMIVALAFVFTTVFAGIGSVAFAAGSNRFGSSTGDRYDTAIAMSKAGWPSSDDVVLASGENFPDALVGAALAKQLDAPLLLTLNAALEQRVKDEITRLGAKNVYIMGTDDVVSSAVEKALTDAGCTVTRVGGVDRYATAVEAAKKIKALGGSVSKVILARADDYPDAVAASATGYPVLFAGNKNAKALNATTKAALTSLGVTSVVITGQSDVVSTEIENEVKAMGITVTRAAGNDRYLTSLEIAKAFAPAAGYAGAVIATGSGYADALAAGPFAAKNGYALFLSGNALNASIVDYVKASTSIKADKIFAAGGSDVVSDAVLNDAVKAATPEVLAVESVDAVTNTRVDVKLSKAIGVVPSADRFVIKDANGASLAVKAVALASDGLTVKLTTASQTANVLYTLTVEGKDYKFVGIPADATKPQLLSAVATKNTKVELAFSEDVDENALNIANYTIAGLSVLKAEYKTDTKDHIILTTSAQTQGTIYKVVVANVTDIAGNVIDPDKDEFQFGGLPADTTKPQLSSAVALKNTKVKVTFNEEMDKATAENIANYTIAGLSVLKAELSSDMLYVTLTTSAQTQGTIYKVVVANVTDVAGNVIDPDKDEFQFGGLPADTTKPQLSSAVALSNTSVKVTFNEEMDKATAENIANYTIAGLTVTKAVLSSDKLYVTLTTSAQTQGTIYKVVVANVTDESGNVIDPDKDEFQFGGLPADTTKPTVLSATAIDNTHVMVVFSEPMDEVTAKQPYNYYLGASLGYPTSVAKATTPNDGSAWVLTTKAQSAVVYTVDVTGVKDLSGNVLDEDHDTATFGGIAGGGDTTAPRVSSAVAIDRSTVQVTFNEEMDTSTIAKGDFVFSVSSGTETVTPVLAGKTADAISVAADKKTVTLQFKETTAIMTQGVVYKVTVSGVTDKAGNAIDSSYDDAFFAGVSTVNPAPEVSSAILLNNQTLKITFSEPVAVSGTIAGTDFTIAPASSFTGVFARAVMADDKKSVTVYYKDQAPPVATDKFTAGNIYTVTVNTGRFNDALGLVPLSSTKNVATFAGISAAVTSPKISSAVAVDKNTVDITFDQPVISSLTSSAVTIDGHPEITAALVRAEGTDGNKIRVFFNGDAPFTTGNVYKVVLDATKITNMNDMQMKAADNNALFAAVATPNPAPKIASATKVGDGKVEVVFTEKITGVDTTDFTISGTGASITGVSFDGDKTVTLTVSGVSAGIYTIGIASTSDIKDEAGVGGVDTTSTASFVY